MKIQIISDIHLEFLDEIPRIPVKARILALLGDIGYPSSHRYQWLIREVSHKFEHVLLVAGNHEFYTGEVNKVLSKIQTIADRHDNVYFLENSGVNIDGQWFYGATLWGNIPKKKYKTVLGECNDYWEIKLGDSSKQLHPTDTTKWHKQTVKWLQQVVDRDSVVLTHHAPILDPRVFDPRDWDLEPSWSASNVMGVAPKFWAYGHTHYPADFVVGGTRYYTNPIGDSPLRKRVREWRYNKVVTLPM